MNQTNGHEAKRPWLFKETLLSTSFYLRFFLGFQTQIFKLLSFLSDAMAAFMFPVLASV